MICDTRAGDVNQSGKSASSPFTAARSDEVQSSLSRGTRRAIRGAHGPRPRAGSVTKEVVEGRRAPDYREFNIHG